MISLRYFKSEVVSFASLRIRAASLREQIPSSDMRLESLICVVVSSLVQSLCDGLLLRCDLFVLADIEEKVRSIG